MQAEFNSSPAKPAAPNRAGELQDIPVEKIDSAVVQEVPTSFPIRDAMEKLYDFYYASDAYRQRYPGPNAAMLATILENGGKEAQRILDFGCGNGRYALPLLDQTQARITGYDISIASLAEFSRHLRNSGHADRVDLIQGDLTKLGDDPRFEIILMLFGVLSHIGARAERLATLRKLRSVIKPDGHLIISVPNVYRRRPLELVVCCLARIARRAAPPLSERGNIFFSRNINGRRTRFFYHLYSVSSLRADLLQSGFDIRACRPESLLPEWLVTQHKSAAWLDRLLLPLLPTALGYGICVVADPA